VKECIVFLDESGDLGWKFHQPYRQGGSSRYLTIASIIVPISKSHLLSRIIKTLYTHHHWEPKKEKKWARMKPEEKLYFAKSVAELTLAHPDIKFLSMTVYKPNVYKHIRKDPNKLYNYMIGLMLLSELRTFNKVIFTPDPRNVKVESGNSLHDYLVTKLWFELDAKTELFHKPKDSAVSKGVQFADMFSGLIQHRFENDDLTLLKLLSTDCVSIRTLFFERKLSLEVPSAQIELETI
jgi:hypothetical protein